MFRLCAAGVQACLRKIIGDWVFLFLLVIDSGRAGGAQALKERVETKKLIDREIRSHL